MLGSFGHEWVGTCDLLGLPLGDILVETIIDVSTELDQNFDGIKPLVDFSTNQELWVLATHHEDDGCKHAERSPWVANHYWACSIFW